MADKKLSRKDLQNAIVRNKNTYTNWFKEPRPVLSLSDLLDLGNVLGITPARLLDEAFEETRQLQLELPFPTGESSVSLELHCKRTGITVRMSPHPSGTS
jgi:hypothetical protein